MNLQFFKRKLRLSNNTIWTTSSWFISQSNRELVYQSEQPVAGLSVSSTGSWFTSYYNR